MGMADPSLLPTLAEIAVALAGFSAIVVLFRRTNEGRWRAEDADQFNGMVIHAVFAALFCLLPAMIEVFVQDPRLLWAIASAVLALQIVGHATGVILLASTNPSGRASMVLGYGLAALLALNAAGVGFDRAFGPYLLGVLWHLLLSGALFVLLVWVPADQRVKEDKP